jgi:ADP-heptose:LPS heptosyltransferase
MSREPERILALRLGGIGEVLAVTPALRRVRERFPRARMTLLAEEPAGEVAGGIVDEVISVNAVYRAQRLGDLFGGRFLEQSCRLVRGLLRRSFDLFLDFHHRVAWRHAVKPAVVAALSRAPRRVGFDKGRAGFFLTDPVPDPDEGHMTLRSQRLLPALGITPSWEEPRLEVAEADRRWAAQLNLGSPLVAFSPGASASLKRWPVEGFAEVARRLARRATVVVTGSEAERELCARVPGLNLAGMTRVGQLAALLERCSLLVSTDSGPVHVAYAVGTPVVGIFLPRAFREWGSYRDARRIRALWREGPGAERGATLPLITPDEVVRAAEDLLDAPPARP